MPESAAVKTYGMSERSDTLDFYIRDETERKPLTRPHRHDYFQIQINLGGDTTQQVGNTTRSFRRGYLSFILPYRVHMVPHPEGSRFIIINFTQQFLCPSLEIDPLDLELMPVFRAPELAPFLFQECMDFMFDDAEFAQIEGLLMNMKRENEQRGFGSLELLRAYLLQLLALVCRKFEAEILRLAAANMQGAGRHDSLQRVIRYIREHLDEELTLVDAAGAAFLSPNYLAHLLKKEIGKTFTELVTERRMERAKDLLANSSRRVADIAFASGFSDEAYFARRFAQLFGMSPRAYRNSLREQAAPGS
jgi:AraC-like DNA-binding protein